MARHKRRGISSDAMTRAGSAWGRQLDGARIIGNTARWSGNSRCCREWWQNCKAHWWLRLRGRGVSSRWLRGCRAVELDCKGRMCYRSFVEERVCWESASCRRGLWRCIERAQRTNGAPLLIKCDGATGNHCPGVWVVHQPGLAVGCISNKDALPRGTLHLGSAAGWDMRVGWAAKDAEVVQDGGLASDGL